MKYNQNTAPQRVLKLSCHIFVYIREAILQQICFCFEKSLNGLDPIEEVPQNMFCIPSAEENIIIEMPQKIQIKTFSAALDHNGISTIIFSSAPALECI